MPIVPLGFDAVLELIRLVTRPCVAPDSSGYDNSVPERKTVGWKAVSYGAGAFAGLVTQRLLEAAWKGLHHASSPPSPADRRASWTDALELGRCHRRGHGGYEAPGDPHRCRGMGDRYPRATPRSGPRRLSGDELTNGTEPHQGPTLGLSDFASGLGRFARFGFVGPRRAVITF